MSEVATSLVLNDGADDGAEESSLELLGFSVDTVRDESGVSNASATALPALLPSVESATSLPALPSTSGQQDFLYRLYIASYISLIGRRHLSFSN